MARPSDDAEFRRIYAAHRDAVVGFCIRRTSYSDALDAAAETFAVAWRRLDELPRDDGSLPWLYGIAHRVMANQRRAGRRLANLRSKLRQTSGAAEARSGPADIVVQAESNTDILAAFGRLRPVDQEVLRLVTWEELARDDAAALLGISRSALDQRLHRAAARLRKEFEHRSGQPSATRKPIKWSPT